MAERARVFRVSQAGISHEDEHTADNIVGSLVGTTAVLRVYNGGQLTGVHSYTGVSRIDFHPNVSKEST